MTTPLALTTKKDIKSIIEGSKFREEISKVLPKHVTPERMARIAITSVMKNPDLMRCTPESVLNCLMICSQAGLEPDGRLAHLIPFKDTCTVIFDFKGLVSLALRNGYESVWADKVCKGDEFFAGVKDGRKVINHTINWEMPRAEAYAYYAVALRGGVVDFEVMSLDEVKGIQARSRAGRSGPWQTDFDEMGKKCPLRRMSKRWDLLPEIRDVINSDDDAPLFERQLPTTEPKMRKVEATVTSSVTPAEPNGMAAVVASIESKAVASKIGLGKLMEFIKEVCPIQSNTLADAAIEAPETIEMVNSQWDDIKERIREAN
jgi:recombination protein RecT